jgi:hypothetical protein
MYRVYESPDGCDVSFCGSHDTYEQAVDAAEKEPAGLQKCDWETARKAGHCGGMYAPDPDGIEDDEPISWHGKHGWHYVVRVRFK